MKAYPRKFRRFLSNKIPVRMNVRAGFAIHFLRSGDFSKTRSPGRMGKKSINHEVLAQHMGESGMVHSGMVYF
jgi:hypothetical protein